MLRYALLDPQHLHSDVSCLCRDAFERLIVTAACTAHENHTGRDVRVLDLIGILLDDVYQQLSGLARTLFIHIHEGNHIIFALSPFFGYVGSLYSRQMEESREK